jgi:hypothetical protein
MYSYYEVPFGFSLDKSNCITVLSDFKNLALQSDSGYLDLTSSDIAILAKSSVKVSTVFKKEPRIAPIWTDGLIDT